MVAIVLLNEVHITGADAPTVAAPVADATLNAIAVDAITADPMMVGMVTEDPGAMMGSVAHIAGQIVKHTSAESQEQAGEKVAAKIGTKIVAEAAAVEIAEAETAVAVTQTANQPEAAHIPRNREPNVLPLPKAGPDKLMTNNGMILLLTKDAGTSEVVGKVKDVAVTLIVKSFLDEDADVRIPTRY